MAGEKILVVFGGACTHNDFQDILHAAGYLVAGVDGTPPPEKTTLADLVIVCFDPATIDQQVAYLMVLQQHGKPRIVVSGNELTEEQKKRMGPDTGTRLHCFNGRPTPEPTFSVLVQRKLAEAR